MPFILASLAFVALGVFSISQIFEQLEGRTKYKFDIQKDKLTIKKFTNDKVVYEHIIKRNEIESFTKLYKNNYGSWYVKYQFKLKDKTVLISDDLVRSEEEIVSSKLFREGYLTDDEKDKLKKAGILK